MNTKHHLTHVVLTFLILVSLTPFLVLAGSTETLAAPPTQSATEVTGIVFEDQNENGIYDEGEAGIADVAVSNGVDVVRTAADGSYTLPLIDDTVYFVTKPAAYMVPVDA
ncbi:MAG: hypothetical protein KDE31_32490, partial [Caldilineaceae bacterium]|nr:hypothetical protein [Caldilineaceae bacterium]